ncbi:MAG: DUF1501 domain-containing protein [Planctomycetaceae bacterium]
MLTIRFGPRGRSCDGVSRRDFIRAGAMGIGAWTLPGLLRTRAAVAASGKNVRPRSVVLLFLAGGPSQFETFDPKPLASSEERTMTGTISTTVPGLHFGSYFEKTARFAHKLAVVRSFQAPYAIHRESVIEVLSGGTTVLPILKNVPRQGASLGSIIARLKGASDPRTGMPNHALLMNPELRERFITDFIVPVRLGSESGPLGSAYAPFEPGGDSIALRNMTLNMSAGQWEDRRDLLRSLDRFRRRVDTQDSLAGQDEFTQQAFHVLQGGAASALDLSHEDPETVRKYDTSGYIVHSRQKPGNSSPSTLGRQLLLARRLAEAGCGFVTVMSSGWDHHSNEVNYDILGGMRNLAPPLDHALAAFLADVESRGLENDILLVVTGEMGRTPKINKDGGRDHWANLSPLLLAGGGLNVGGAIGRSTSNGGEPATTPHRCGHLAATILHALFDIGQLRLDPTLPDSIRRLIENERPIEGLA